MNLQSEVRRAAELLTVAVVVLCVPSSASAAAPERVLQIPEGQISPGEGAGELDHPRGIAGDSETGHVYIADRRNARVSEYTSWGLFVKSWGWGVADGSPELQTCGPPEPQEDPDPSLCRKGLTGEEKGQMALLAGGMAVDDEGNIWVGDLENLRVQKFSPAGDFLLMVGGDVNKTKVDGLAPVEQRNVCSVESGDVCQKGISGEGPSQLSGALGDLIDYSPTTNAVLIGDKGGIQVFDLDGTHRETIPFSGPLAGLAGQAVNALDVDEDGSIYFSLSGADNVYKLSSAGAPLTPGKPGESKFTVDDPLGVAVDVDGRLYVIEDPPGVAPLLEGRVLVFDAAGNRLVSTKAEEEAEEFFPYVPPFGPAITGLATNICSGSKEPGSLYVTYFTGIFEPPRSFVEVFGTPPTGCEPPPPRPPEIVAQFATSVGRHEATVKAEINPLFWPDATYYVEYGTGRCIESKCAAKIPLSSALLTSNSVNAPVRTAALVLEGLEPGTTYHYRFVAQSSGGGPTVGIDPDGRVGPAEASTEAGLEETFTTFRSPSLASACPNDPVRAGLSVQLPDCRAYEMISPLDKGGGDVALWEGRNAVFPQFLEIHQSDLSGNRFTYSSAFGFGAPSSATFVSQYLTRRTPTGWESQAISPPRTESPVNTLFSNEVRGFDETLCQAWIRHYSVAPLAPGGVEQYANLYRRENCGVHPALETLTIAKPLNRTAAEYFELQAQGASRDGKHNFFIADGRLHTDAPDLKGEQELLLYEKVGGELRFVCYLPSGKASPQACSAGTVAGGGGSTSSIHNAVSADGSRVFWSTYIGSPGFGNEPGAPGQIYVRINGNETRKVSTTKALDPAWFWTASDDGSRVVFEFDSGLRKDELYELDVDTQEPTLIAKGVEGPMGVSEDARRIYFASTEDLDGTGPASAGDHNLYLYEVGDGPGGARYVFIGPLASRDLNGTDKEPAAIDEVPAQRSARVSPDGLHVTFTSVADAAATGYDNRDVENGAPVQEVYLYDAVDDELRCVSCNSTSARPVADNIGFADAPYLAAARIQGWELLLHAPRVLSDDGTRVFFESFEALVPRDTNANWDVYQWEEEGKGTCKASSETFVEESGGCVDLISSGLSSAKSTFLDADPSGDNIFFSTQSSLVKADYGLNDVYVARVGGGFHDPVEEEECEGEACQAPPPPPAEVTPSTELSSGPGNVPAVKQRKARRCAKGKRRVKRAGKVKCVKRKKAKGAKKAKPHKNRRAGR